MKMASGTPMRPWWTVALVSVVMIAASERPRGQARGSGGNQSHRPAGRPAQPSSPPGLQGELSRPLPAGTNQRFRSAMPVVPAPFGGRHTRFPARSSWFGLMVFDPFWLGAPSAVDQNVMLPSVPPRQRPGLAGGLQLDVEPRRALVYVDGWYVGVVDDLSGYYRHLDTVAGRHIIEIVAPDYEPLIVDVTVSPGRTTTYRNSLTRAPGRH
jgi:hypothetical protein